MNNKSHGAFIKRTSRAVATAAQQPETWHGGTDNQMLRGSGASQLQGCFKRLQRGRPAGPGSFQGRPKREPWAGMEEPWKFNTNTHIYI